LNRYLTNGDVSSSTKNAIRTFISGMIAFKVTSDVLNSFNGFTSLTSQAEKLANKAQSDIDEEERKRRRKKQEEEEEEDRRRRAAYSAASSYSSYSSSSSSSDSGSSFGGFGGGDSGGGGSSGDW
jgi:predicted Zn-dependent peptidase